MLKFYATDVVCQEVPDELSLSFAIAGCTHHCPGCSWDVLKSAKVFDLTDVLYTAYLNKHKDLVTCILFLGGEWDPDIIKKLKQARDMGFKTCLYTGAKDVPQAIKKYLTYLKVGEYNKKLGGLESETTNQQFIRLSDGKCLNYLFRRKVEL